MKRAYSKRSYSLSSKIHSFPYNKAFSSLFFSCSPPLYACWIFLLLRLRIYWQVLLILKIIVLPIRFVNHFLFLKVYFWALLLFMANSQWVKGFYWLATGVALSPSGRGWMATGVALSPSGRGWMAAGVALSPSGRGWGFRVCPCSGAPGLRVSKQFQGGCTMRTEPP